MSAPTLRSMIQWLQAIERNRPETTVNQALVQLVYIFGRPEDGVRRAASVELGAFPPDAMDNDLRNTISGAIAQATYVSLTMRQQIAQKVIARLRKTGYLP